LVIFQNYMGKRILIADDSVTIQKAFALTLTGEDFTLTPARSADEGLTLARQTRPDLVIADATMPGRSGYELCASLKADAALRGIPVYILSSTQQPYDEAKGNQVGADGNLTKPWESTSLIEKMKGAMGQPVAAPAARPASLLPKAALDSTEYEVSMDAPRDTAPAPVASMAPVARAPSVTATSMPAVRVPAATAPPAPSVTSGGMRPSLIPGIRPGAMPPARPGTSPSRTLGASAPMVTPAVPPRPAASAPMGRTLFGLPAASMPFPGSTRPAPSSAPGMAPPPSLTPAAPAPRPAPLAMPTPSLSTALPTSMPSASAPSASALSASLPAHVSSVVDQRVAALAAKGPEYEVLAKLSREIIEQIVWEIVPELADAIIREQLEKRGRA
jgi:CheY-like chemotaxis protein